MRKQFGNSGNEEVNTLYNRIGFQTTEVSVSKAVKAWGNYKTAKLPYSIEIQAD